MAVAAPFSGSARQMLDLVYTLSSLLVDSEDRQIMVDGVEYSDKTTVKFSVSPPAGHSASLCPTDINRYVCWFSCAPGSLHCSKTGFS